ncbi:MAG: PTS sugar transporter subunit IIA [Oscillospiraceae bacterium]
MSIFKKGKRQGEIFATQDGVSIDVSEVPDEVFSSKMLGESIAIIPSSNDVFSPVNGTVVDVNENLHAYSITSDDNVDVLVHIGIDTVELKGEGFESFVKVGDNVKVGDKLATADLDFIKSKGYGIHTIIILNNDEIKDLEFNNKDVEKGKDIIIKYNK